MGTNDHTTVGCYFVVGPLFLWSLLRPLVFFSSLLLFGHILLRILCSTSVDRHFTGLL